MVHALQEAHRVLKPQGLLIDLRPAPAHRRLGLGEGRRWQFVGLLHEVLDDDHAADAAVAQVVRERLFRRESRTQFQFDRVMDTLDEVRVWLGDFDQRRELPSHEPLLERLQRKRDRLKTPEKITVRGPIRLALLRKLDDPMLNPTFGGHMILAIFPDSSHIESLLNNLSEADFDLKDVSVVMQDAALGKKIAKDAGPLKGIQAARVSDALQGAGITEEMAKQCHEAVSGGQVLVAMNVDPKYAAAAREMFADHSARIIKE